MIFNVGVEVIIASRSTFVGPGYPSPLNPFKEIGTFDHFEGLGSRPVIVYWGTKGGNNYGHRDLLVVSSEEINQFETPDQFFCHMKEKMDGLCDQFHLPKNEDEFIGYPILAVWNVVQIFGLHSLIGRVNESNRRIEEQEQ